MSELRKIERPAFLAWVDAYIVEHGHPPAPEDVWFARAELDATNAVHSTHLSAVYDVFHIGSQVRSIGTLLANCRNSSRRADCLSGIEQLFNYEVPDEDNPLETIEECDLNWGHERGQYVEAFKAALPAFLTRHPEYAAHLAAEPTAVPERREVPSGDPASETRFAAAAASAVDEIKTTMPDENSPEFRAACSMAMKASQAGVGPCGVFIAGYRALRGISVDVGVPLSRASDALVTLAAARAGATLTDASAHAMYEAAMRAMEQGGPYATLEASTAAVVRNLFAAISPASVPETINENSHP